MAQSLISNGVDSTPLKPGTFRSILPILDDILSILHDQATSENGDAQSTEAVVPKAKELAIALEDMKKASIALPGGHLSIEEIKRLSEIMEEEAEKRKRILDVFVGRDMPHTDTLGATARTGVDGDLEVDEGSTLPTPNDAP